MNRVLSKKNIIFVAISWCFCSHTFSDDLVDVAKLTADLCKMTTETTEGFAFQGRTDNQYKRFAKKEFIKNSCEMAEWKDDRFTLDVLQHYVWSLDAPQNPFSLTVPTHIDARIRCLFDSRHEWVCLYENVTMFRTINYYRGDKLFISNEDKFTKDQQNKYITDIPPLLMELDI